VAIGDVADRCGEEVRVLDRGEVASGEGHDFGPRHTLAGGRDLPVLVGILLASTDVQGDRAVQLVGDPGKVPARRLAAVPVDEPRGEVEERRSVPPRDGRSQIRELPRGWTMTAGEQACLLQDRVEQARRALRSRHPERAQRSAQQRRAEA
jgi:hypothetical protein